MALPAVVDSIEVIPESIRGHYKQVDDKYVLDADIENHPQVQGLRGAYKSDHEKVSTLKQTLEKYKDVDPDKWHKIKHLSDEDLELIESVKTGGGSSGTRKPLAMDTGSVDIEAEIEKRLRPVKSAHQTELNRMEAQLRSIEEEKARVEDRMRRTQIQTALTAACAEVGVLPSAVEDVVYFGQRFFKVTDDGEVVATDNSGVEMFGQEGKPMRAKEWLLSRAPEKSHWFPLSSGGGAGGSRFNGEVRPSRKADLKSPGDKVAFIRKYGSQAFLDLAD